MSTFISEEIDNSMNINQFNLGNVVDCNTVITTFQNPFLLINQNIRSANRNLDEFIVTISNLNKSPDCIVLTEAHLNLYSPTDFNIPEYNCFTTKEVLNKNSGVVVFVKKKYSISMVKEIPMLQTNCLQIQIVVQNKTIQIFAIYRTHGSQPLQFINELQEIITKCKNNYFTIVTGDFNLNIDQHYNSNVKEEYLNVMVGLNYISCINHHTRVVPGQTPSCIDHIWTNSKEIDKIKTIVWKTNITDHYTCLFVYEMQNMPRQQNTNQDKYLKINMNVLRLKVEKERWSTVLDSNDAEICATNFEDILNSHLLTASEEKHYKSNSKFRKIKPWITHGIIVSIRKKEKLFHLTKKYSQNSQITIYYKKYRNNLTYLIKKTKENYYGQKLNEAGTDNKLIWNVIKDVLGKKKHTYNKIGKIMDDKNIINTDKEPIKCANLFNNYFSTVGVKLAKNINLDYHRNMHDGVDTIPSTAMHSFSEFKKITEEETKIIINNLRSSSSPGYDKITVDLLKILSDHLLKPITHIINTSFENGKFPSNYKTTIVTPIFKSGNEMEISNYRPISLISNVAKIYEKAVKKQLTEFIKKKTLLHENQYGFREGLSTQDAIAKLTSIIYDALDKKEKCLAIYIDLKKAFDSISHIKLLLKLKLMGISGKALSWFHSYLNNRSQCVKINSKISQPASSQFGIPQGTVIGPILFILYVNQMFNLPLKGQIISYADDTVLILKEKTWENINLTANADLRTLKNWFDENYLTMNSEKTFFMKYALNNKFTPSNLDIKIHNKNCSNNTTCNEECRSLKSKETVKYLGIIIDENIKWKEQIQQTITRIRKLFYVFINIRNLLSKNIIRNIYCALAQSLLQYAIVGWGGAFKVHISPLEVAQRKLIKIITKKPQDYPTQELFKDFKVLSVSNIYKKNSLLQIYKEKNTATHISQRQRSKGKLNIEQINTTTAQHHYTYTGKKMFNELPERLRLEDNYLKFKEEIKKLFL